MATPSNPDLFITLPEQAAADLTAEALEALTEAVFLNADPLPLFVPEGITVNFAVGDLAVEIP